MLIAFKSIFAIFVLLLFVGYRQERAASSMTMVLSTANTEHPMVFGSPSPAVRVS
jgi:hypothetical protein